MISRSVGPEIGGAVGVLFCLGKILSVALYIVGFGETLAKMQGRSGSK